MANPTTNLNITLPEPGAESSRGQWGETLNNAVQSLDTAIATRGVPSGGTDGQILTKNGTTDYATQWANNMTGAQIKSAYEGESDTNAFTDADHTKLDGIEASADVTDATNVNAAGAVMHTDIPDSDTGLVKRTGSETYDIDTATYLTANQTITASGDATGSGTTSIALTLANSGVSAGSYGSSSLVPVVTFDAKGRATSVTTAATASVDDATALAIALG